jgi:hypothetical protein
MMNDSEKMFMTKISGNEFPQGEDFYAKKKRRKK